MPAPAACPFCDQEPETLQHLLLGCVLARQVWTVVLTQWNRQAWIPTADTELVQWWIAKEDAGVLSKDSRAAVLLVLWSIWSQSSMARFLQLTRFCTQSKME